MNNFWQKLPRPFSMLSPMEDVTDTVFRQMLIKIGRPDVFYTEFVNVEGMNSKGRDKVIHRLKFSKKEQPIVAQIWGDQLTHFVSAAKDIAKMGFAGIDLNMGCSQRTVTNHGCGSAVIDDEKKAGAIIKAVIENAPNLPISVKTRLGFLKIDTTRWIKFLLQQNIQAITLHGRTAKQDYSTKANWDEIAKAVSIKNQINPKVVIVGNGDVSNWQDILQKCGRYGVDGVAIGRAILQNPFAFCKQDYLKNNTLKKRLTYLLEHAKLFSKTWKNNKKYYQLKKYFKMYLSGFDHVTDLRRQLMLTKSLDELTHVLNSLPSTK